MPADPEAARGATYPLAKLVAGAFLVCITAAGLWLAYVPNVPRASLDFDPIASMGSWDGSRGFVGAETCASCHPGEHAHYVRSGHARTLAAAAKHGLARRLDGRIVEDPERPQERWDYELLDSGFRVSRVGSDGRNDLPIHFAIGSGHHATSFVTLLNQSSVAPRGLEHRLTYYAKGDTFGVTPGQAEDAGLGRDGDLGFEMSATETLKCLGCHSTRTLAAGRAAVSLGDLIPNVSCERCHGPAADHVEAAKRGDEDLAMPFGDEGESADRVISLCGECHRHPSKAPPEMIRPDNRQLARFQPVGLTQSACYLEGDGRLDCTTCHDPHANSSTSTASYDAVCLSCHGPAEKPRGSASCVNCHMPKVDPGQGVLFADHWIRVRVDSVPAGSCSRPAAMTPAP